MCSLLLRTWVPFGVACVRSRRKREGEGQKQERGETISLMDHKQRKIVYDLRLISLEADLEFCTENFVFSALYKNRTDN